MEEHCSTGQSPQWTVVPMEEGEEELFLTFQRFYIFECISWAINQLISLRHGVTMKMIYKNFKGCDLVSATTV